MDFFSRLSSLRVHCKNGDRAPHKPLYLLYLLASIEQGSPRMHPFKDVESRLAEAIRRFGKNTKSAHPEYPFCRIKNDELGEVIPSEWSKSELRGGEKEPKKSALLAREACGGLLLSDYDHFVSNSDSVRRACHKILDDHFPVSLHEEIMYFFGFSFGKTQEETLGTELVRIRDKAFKVYGHRCAISGYSGPMGLGNAGLESAEILWLNHGGAVQTPNIIVMTTFHRKLFHLGAFSLDEEYRILLSEYLQDQPSNLGLESGRKVYLPKDRSDYPSLACLNWHRSKVFKS